MSEQKFSTLALVSLTVCATGLYCYKIHSAVKSTDARIKHFENKELLDAWRTKRDNAIHRLRVFNGTRTFTANEANLIANAIEDLQIMREAGWKNYTIQALPPYYFSAIFHGDNPLGSNDSVWLTHSIKETEPIRSTNTVIEYRERYPFYWRGETITPTNIWQHMPHIIITNRINDIIFTPSSNITWSINNATNITIKSTNQ